MANILLSLADELEIDFQPNVIRRVHLMEK